MSDIIKLYIKQVEQSSGPDQFRLDEIKGGTTTLFEDNSSVEISLGSGQYDFQIEVFLDDGSGTNLKHTIYLTQDESDETLRPAKLPGESKLSLPQEKENTAKLNDGSTRTTQDESDETLKPGDLPGEKRLFG